MEIFNTLLVAGLTVLLLVSLAVVWLSIRKCHDLQESQKQLFYAQADTMDRNLILQHFLAEYASKKAGFPLPVYSNGEPWHPQDEITFRPLAGGGTRNGTIILNIGPEGTLQDGNPLVVFIGSNPKNPERIFFPQQISDVCLTCRPQFRKSFEEIEEESHKT